MTQALRLPKDPPIIKEAKEHMRHVMLPKLIKTPSYEGFIQVALLGVKKMRNGTFLSEIEMRLATTPNNNGVVLYRFGKQIVKTNQLMHCDVPFTRTPEIGIGVMFLQTGVIGTRIDKYGVQQANILMRFTDKPKEQSNVLMNMGFAVIFAGKAVSINNAKFKVNLQLKKRSAKHGRKK